MGAAEKRLDKRRNEVRLPSNIKWLGREGSNLRMAESKSGGKVSNSKHRSEFLYDFALSKINYLAGCSE
jgi:hypothetical protein